MVDGHDHTFHARHRAKCLLAFPQSFKLYIFVKSILKNLHAHRIWNTFPVTLAFCYSNPCFVYLQSDETASEVHDDALCEI